MPLTKWKRPRTIRLPGNYIIKIVYWSEKKIKGNLAKDGSLFDKDLLGFWDVATQSIVINSSEPLWVQLKTLAHEVVHAAHDYGHWLEQAYVEPIMQEVGETMVDEMEDEG